MRNTRRTICWSFLLLTFSGCGYTVGNSFSPEIRTISVPIFQNDTYRRGLEYQLTEAVHKQIRGRTPYKLVHGDQADTRLIGRIVEVRKDVLGGNRFGDPRELQMSLMVRVSWEDVRTGKVLSEQDMPVADSSILQTSQAEFAPEMGQSLATATNDAVNQMATKIINMLEAPW